MVMGDKCHDPAPTVLEAGWAPGPVWTVAEDFAPNEIRSQDRLARSESLYRLSYPSSNNNNNNNNNNTFITREASVSIFLIHISALKYITNS